MGFPAIFHLLVVYSPQTKNRNEHEDRKGESQGKSQKRHTAKNIALCLLKKALISESFWYT